MFLHLLTSSATLLPHAELGCAHDQNQELSMSKVFAGLVAALLFASVSAEAATGVASFYKTGAVTANGERYNPNGLTAAHPKLPFGTMLKVTNLRNGKSVVVRVNDRGPFVKRRILDLSYGAAKQIGLTKRGVGKIKYEVLD
jgi:rare lipoprotein A